MRITLVSDGSSDRALIPLIRWLLSQHGAGPALDVRWADFQFLRARPSSLREKIVRAVELNPCDLLLIHRDAENQPIEDRKQEIAEAIEELEAEGLFDVPSVCLVPIRMTEAWLLIEELAVRRAAGNPAGTMNLSLPRVNRIESRTDPKKILFDALEAASGHSGRRLAKLNVSVLRYRVAEFISDYSPLRRLSAFRAFEQDIVTIIPTLDL